MTEQFRVVRNAQNQYSFLKWDAPDVPGWSSLGIGGSKQHCIEYIETHWCDNRGQSITGGGNVGRVSPILEGLRLNADRWPLRNAVIQGDRGLTFDQLDRRSSALACALRRGGVKDEEPVIFLGRGGPEAVVALFGIMKAGAVYLPIDSRNPADRLAFIAEDAGARIVLTSEDNQQGTSVERMVAQGKQAERVARPIFKVRDDQIAYIIYTSGSTGLPKGVEVEHKALENFIAWTSSYGIAPTDRVTQLCSIGFDVSIWDMVPTIVAGAELHIPTSSDILFPRELMAWLDDAQITIAFMPTPIGALFLDGFRKGDMLPLRLLFVGGAQLKRWPPAWFGADVINIYGPTEATIVVSVTDPEEARGNRDITPSIGRPLQNVGFRILDDNLHEVAPGVAGQLFIEGLCLARGYRRRRALTAEKFLPNPYGSPGSRMYASGDLARCLPDGRFEWLGRIDRQLKLHGYRIEPEEIERVLSKHPAVRAAAVVPIYGRRSGSLDRIEAFVELAVGVDVSVEVLATFLAGCLPYYMIPARVHLVEKMPWSVNGKIDYGVLRALHYGAKRRA